MTTNKLTRFARRLTVILMVVAMAVSCAYHSENSLNKLAIMDMEKRIELPKGANKIEDYTRCYYPDSANSKLVHGTYLLSSVPGEIGFDSCQRDVLILDGGCTAITILIDWERKIILSARCNGDA